MEQQYISMMIESLEKKNDILKMLLDKSIEQKELISNPNMSWDMFDLLVDQKADLIEQLSQMDDGFQSLFEHVKVPLTIQKEKYRKEITALQELIRQVTEKSTQLQTQEQRNKTVIEAKFAETRQNIKQSKATSKAAMEYYQKMNRINLVDPQLMDKKR